jgi:putative transport protein
MTGLLGANPVLLLFVVAAAGYLLGRVRLFGLQLGVAGVLFAGLGLSALEPTLRLPEVLQTFGLVIFVYTIGLSSGPTFFATLRRSGLRDGLFVLGGVGVACLAVLLLVVHGLGARPELGVGLFAGALTNTPALAAVLEVLRSRTPDGSHLLTLPVVGYSLAYPIGAFGVILAIHLAQRLCGVPPAARAKGDTPSAEPLEDATIDVTRTSTQPLRSLMREQGCGVKVVRLLRRGEVRLVEDDTVVEPGDRVGVVGPPTQVTRAAQLLGARSSVALHLDRRVLDFRRIVVSEPALAYRPLRDLQFQQKYGAIITRIRRGDVDRLANGTDVLELGDRVRVVAPRERLGEVAELLGDSYRSLSEVDVVSVGLGIALGLLLGHVPIGLPGGAALRLGTAGGPLVVGLVLGWRRRTGPLLWGLPYNASLTLRQLGAVCFLAAVGTKAGGAFVQTLREPGAWPLLAAGAAITLTVAFGLLFVGHRWLRLPTSLLMGMVAGVHTQPAALAVAVERTKSEAPNSGYARVFALATLTKILVAQLLVLLAGGS